ncbi:MAG: hypothetical protein N2512_07815 [Armatimonadetes bacterium]|nr:hypothetical protein [Armatimonadota bacterium]
MTALWVCAALSGTVLAQGGNFPLGGGASGLEGLRLAVSGGVTTKLEGPGGAAGNTLILTFDKPGEERRLLALAVPLPLRGDPAAAKAIEVKYRLDLAAGQPPKLALVAWEKGGEAWYKLAAESMITGEEATGRLSVTTLTPTAFSQDASGALEWDALQALWLGVALDGAARGALEVRQARFTSEPYRPQKPLRVTGDGPGQWTVASDPAVQAKLTTPNEGPGGKPCMRFDFTFPGRRHMYALPVVPLPPADLSDYRGVQFTYKATLPPGIRGLLVTLWEQGGAHYEGFPYPPPSDDWVTVTMPFEDFKLAGWTRDANNRLDLDRLTNMVIGLHGTADADVGTGTIWVCDVEFVP